MFVLTIGSLYKLELMTPALFCFQFRYCLSFASGENFYESKNPQNIVIRSFCTLFIIFMNQQITCKIV